MLWEYAIDAGSENLRLVKRGAMEIRKEPSYAAVRAGRETPFLWGERALRLRGREPAGVKVRKFINAGQIENADDFGRWALSVLDEDAELLKRDNVLLCVSPFMRQSRTDEILKLLTDSGISAVGTVKAELAAALGAGENVMEAEASCVLNIGYETTFGAIMAGGRIVKTDRLPYGMSRVKDDILLAVRARLGCAVSDKSARELLAAFGCEDTDEGEMEKPAFDYRTFLPAMKKIPFDVVADAIAPFIREMAAFAEKLVLFLPEELSADITRRGIVLTDGGARLNGLENAIKQKTGLPARTADMPEACTPRGLLRILNSQRTYAALIADETRAMK